MKDCLLLQTNNEMEAVTSQLKCVTDALDKSCVLNREIQVDTAAAAAAAAATGTATATATATAIDS